MAFGKFKETWFIWVLVVVAAVFTVLAFTKEKPKDQMAPVQGALSAHSQANLPVQPATAPISAPTIKPDHSAADMQKIAAMKKPASTVVMPPQEVTPRDMFAVQVYSFKERTRADIALKALKDKGYTAYIMVSDLGPRGIWYRVRVGSFTSEDEAQKILEAITKDFKSGILVSE